MDDTLLDLGFDSLDRATLAMRLEDDLALEIAEEDREAAWADMMPGDITLEQLVAKAEAMAGR
jgi:acyl carrier protein